MENQLKRTLELYKKNAPDMYARHAAKRRMEIQRELDTLKVEYNNTKDEVKKKELIKKGFELKKRLTLYPV